MGQLRTIRLYGKLGVMFGREHQLAVSSPSEAIRALCVLNKGLEEELMHSADKGVGYVIYEGKTNVRLDTLRNGISQNSDTIRIAPVVQGAKRGGLGQVILGVLIVVAAVWTGGIAGAGVSGGLASGAGGASALGSASFMGVTGGYALAAQLGVAMALGGVAQMVAPNQKGMSAKDTNDNGASYNMNGAVNVSAQGGAIPVLYGECYVGSVVASAGIYSEDKA